jgi:hypothetical protein
VIPSLSTKGQPSVGETADLVKEIKHANVRAIFAESSVNTKVEQAIARETGAKVGRALWADTWGPRIRASAGRGVWSRWCPPGGVPSEPEVAIRAPRDLCAGFEDRPRHELAAEFGLSESTTAHRLVRARRSLESALDARA